MIQMKQTSIQLASIDEQKPVTTPVARSRPPPPPPNLPLDDLLKGPREDYIEIGVPLYEASITGNWKVAEAILNKNKQLIRSAITENYETPLHIAASAKNTKQVEEFVKNLVNLMEKEDLVLQNKNYNTALNLAVVAGNVGMATTMVNKNKVLLEISGSQEMMPLYTAALFGKHKMVWYLYDNSKKMTGDFWSNQNRGWVLEKCVENDLFDVALQIVKDCPELAISGSVLGVLARKPEALSGTKSNIIWRKISSIFAVIGLREVPLEKESEALQLLRIVWKNIAKKSKTEIDDIIRGPETTSKDPKASSSGNEKKKYPSRILFVAAEMGNTKFLVELIRQYPDLIWKLNDNNQSIFHIAVKHRHEGIYNLLYEIGSMKDLLTPLKDDNDNNMLHLVGKSAKKKRLQDVSGVAFQMQLELLWFKEVQAMIPPSYRERRNKDGLTPHELFTKEHKDLLSQGEKWMKGTASQCMVVAALIATIVFAAAFTVPGGYNQNDGIRGIHRGYPG